MARNNKPRLPNANIHKDVSPRSEMANGGSMKVVYGGMVAFILPPEIVREQNDVINVIMAAALTLTMDRSRLTCLVVLFVLYMHLAKSTMSLAITRHSFGMRQLRKRRQEKCSETFNVFEGQYDVNAQLENGEPVGNAAWWCMLNAHCMGFVVKGEKVFFSSSTNRSFINDTFAIIYTVNLRCPSSFRCGNSPCKNGGMCRREWKCWCCEQLKSCADEPCDLEETCRNSTTAGFICTSNVTSTTKTVASTNIIVSNATKTVTSTNTIIVTSTPKTITSRNTIVTSKTTPNKTMDGSVLSRDAKVVIGAAAVGGVVITGVAAVAVISVTSSAAATTAAEAAGGQ